MKIGDIKYIVDIDSRRPYIYEVKIIRKYDNGNYRAEFIEKILDFSSAINLIGDDKTFSPEDFFSTVRGAVLELTSSPWGMNEYELIRKLFK